MSVFPSAPANCSVECLDVGAKETTVLISVSVRRFYYRCYRDYHEELAASVKLKNLFLFTPNNSEVKENL